METKKMTPRYYSFTAALNALTNDFRSHSFPVHTEKWQGMDIKHRPEAEMREMIFVDFMGLVRTEDLGELAQQIKPNLPWADQHFIEERVSGEPINPGQTWKTWPWGNAADKHRTEGEQFNHSYAERYWPKRAGQTKDGSLGVGAEWTKVMKINEGIRYNYGDLMDVVNLLLAQPQTRQAFLPVFFPEDTGAVHGGRIPCSIGYHFFMRDKVLHISYWLRSCDMYRHLRDDIYLTVRLLLWVLNNLRVKDPKTWDGIKPGFLHMSITSLHMFINDYRTLYGSNPL
jgi:hypothetical protein